MYNEAIAFFYASNRIVILPDRCPENAVFAGVDEARPVHQSAAPEQSNATQPDAAEQADTLLTFDSDRGEYAQAKYKTHDATKIFMERVGLNALKLIRTLEIVFPRIGSDSSLLDTDPAYKEWCMAIDYLAYLATGVDVSKLTLIVHIWTTPTASLFRWPLKRTAHILDTQSPRLLKVLRTLSELQLRRLFVHLEWPKHWSPPKLLHDIETSKVPKQESPGCAIGEHRIPLSNEILVEQEIWLEQMVMGAEYDSYSVGKGDELPSQWLRGEWDSML
jgi:hypothetical protein